jgi:glutathione S-transferase
MGLKGYNLVTMPFPPRVFHREYLKRNVLGTIPYFEDSETGAGMTESCAAPQYLLNVLDPTNPLAVQVHENDYGAYLNWLSHADATLTFPQTVVLRYTLQEPGVADAAAVGYGKWFVARLRMIDNFLSEENGSPEFLCEGRLTIADICVTYALYLGQTLVMPGDDAPLSARYKPQTKAYLERMMRRPAWAAAEIAQDASAVEFDKQFPQQKSKM